MSAFDLNTEVFTVGIELPTECLCLLLQQLQCTIVVITSQINERIHTFNLWTLDDEACLRGGGVEASWSEILSVDVDFPIHSVCGCFNSRPRLSFV